VSQATGTIGIVAVASKEIGGVRIKRPALEVETERSVHLLRRVGLRARRWLQAHEEELVVREVVGVTKDGSPIEREIVTPSEVLESVKVHAAGVRDLLREQRERAKLASTNSPPLSDAEFQAELLELARETLRSMPESEFQMLLLERGAIAADATEQPTGGEL
jgi:hypothetical protein